MIVMPRSEMNSLFLPSFTTQLNTSTVSSTPTPIILSNKRKKSYDDDSVIPASVKRCNSNPSQPETYRLLYKAINTDSDLSDRLPMTFLPNRNTQSEDASNPPKTFDYSCYWPINDKDVLTSTLYSYFSNRAIPSNATQYVKSVVIHCFKEIITAFPPDPALYQYATIDEVIKLIMTGKKGHSLRETCCHEHYPTSYEVYTINHNQSSQVILVNEMNKLMNLYERYPYLKKTIIESIAVKLNEEIQNLKNNIHQLYNYNHLVKFCTDLRIYNIEIIKIILRLFLSDIKLLYFNSILIYLHKVVFIQPEYVSKIIIYLLKTESNKCASIQVGIAKIFQDYLTNSPKLTLQFTTLIFNYCIRLSNSLHSYILLQTLMTLSPLYAYLNPQQKLLYSILKQRIIEEIKHTDLASKLDYLIL